MRSGPCGGPDFDFSIGGAGQGQPYEANDPFEVVPGVFAGQKPSLSNTILPQPEGLPRSRLPTVVNIRQGLGHSALCLEGICHTIIGFSPVTQARS